MGSLFGFQLTVTGIVTIIVMIYVGVVWIYNIYSRRRLDRLTANLKGPRTNPIKSALSKYFATNRRVMDKIIKQGVKYGIEPSKVWMGSTFTVTIMKPEDVQIVLNNSMSLQKGCIYNYYKNILGEGLVTAPVDKWRKHRRIISSMFSTNQLKSFFSIFNEKSQNLVRNLKREVGKTQMFDLSEYMDQISLDIICQSAMGYDLGTRSNDISVFLNAFKKITELDSMRYFKPWLQSNFMFSIYLRLTGQPDIEKTLCKLPNQVIQEKKKTLAQRKITNKAGSTNFIDEKENGKKLFLDTLLELNEYDAKFSNEDLKDHVLTFMSAGMDTTSNTISFCLLLLAIHSDIQDKVFDEINNIFGDDDRPVTFDDTLKLIYLEQVIKETIRLFPIIPTVMRLLQVDVKIFSGNMTIPKGTTCMVNIFGTHHRPELYPNPWAFNPDNFNPDNVAKRHRYSFIGFSGGPRDCIGSNYAKFLMKVLISTFLRNYSVHTDIQLNDIKLSSAITMRSVYGFPVTIRSRE